MKRLLFATVSACLLLMLGMTAWGYTFNPGSPKWQGASTPFYVGIPGTSASGIKWADALIQAAQEWNDKTAFEFEIIDEYIDPCIGTGPREEADFRNGADFRSTICGSWLSRNTLAVTVYFPESNILGSGDMVEADIIFNSNISFDIYDGPLRVDEYDFRRVALHELGHVLGLSHEDKTPAIMNSRIGDLFTLQPDDIDGVNRLYAGLSSCTTTPVGFGWTFGALEPGDCVVQHLMAGGTDTSYVDVMTLDLGQRTRISMDVKTDGKLDSVLFLATDGLVFIDNDQNSGGDCHPHINADLPAGRYVILVNTYAHETPCAKQTTGAWRLALTYDSSQLLLLPGKVSFQGTNSDARFFGGVTVDGGRTYSNRVGPNQPFDVVGRIEIDPRHQGQPGFIAMAVMLDGEILVKNREGHFVAYQPQAELVPIAECRVLGAVEHLQLLTQFIASSAGVHNGSVDFLIGYGLDSNPDELYFHQQPINLLVE